MQKGQFECEVQVGASLMQALVFETGLSESLLTEAAQKGAVWVALKRGKGKARPRRARSLDAVVATGSVVMLNYDPDVLALVPPAHTHCLSDQVNYGIWYKPAGMLSQGSKWSDHTTITQVASTLRQGNCYLVHRLDRAACGLMLLAYTKNALQALTKLFEARQIDKLYQASVHGQVDFTLPHHIDTPLDDKSAKTTVQSVQHDLSDNTSTLMLNIESGRKHQIRRHLSQAGHPIVGDRLYRATDTPSTPEETDLQLVACELGLVCPFTGTPIDVSINPNDALAGRISA